MRAVLLDLHHTLVVAGSMDDWVRSADATTTQLPAERLARVRASLPRVWELVAATHAAGSWDLDASLHRSAFVDALVSDAEAPRELAERIYDTLPDHWQLQDGALELLTALRESGLKTALVSNIGFDVRAGLERLGVGHLLDEVVLSYEVGLVKPDPAIFRLALDRLGVNAGEAVMIGDSAHDDGGAAAAGIATFLLPMVPDDGNGRRSGLAASARILLDGLRNC